MYCNKCGQNYEEDVKFCKNCGTELEKKEELSPREHNLEKKRLLKEKIKNGPASLKFAYYSRIILPALYALQLLIIIGLLIYAVATSGDSDAAGYGLLAIMVMGPIMLVLYSPYYLINLLCDIIIPTLWINSKKEITTGREVFIIIVLVILYILNVLPFIIYILSGFNPYWFFEMIGF